MNTTTKNAWKSAIFNINFYIAIFFLLGLENVNLPPIDDHSWRQTLTISIAKNFVDHPNIFYPRMDIGGSTEGIMATEFPIYSYILSIFYRIFGFQDWYGRLLNWALAAIMLLAFYRIILRIASQKVAFYAVLAMMSSIIFQFARRSMPDSFAISFVIFGILYVYYYLDRHKTLDFWLAGLFLTLGLLTKISYVPLLAFLVFPFLDPAIPKSSKIRVLAMVAGVMALVVLWYYAWVPHLLEHYKNPLMFPATLAEGWQILVDNFDQTIYRFRTNAFSHFLPYYFAIFSIVLAIYQKEKHIIAFSFTSIVLCLIFIVKSGIVFSSHNYYVMFAVPSMAFLIGHFVANFPTKKEYLVLVVTMAIFSTGWLFNRQASFSQNGLKHLLTLSDIMDKYVDKQDKIMINTGIFNPTSMFFAKRHGWAVNPDVVKKYDWMPDFKKDGLKYILIDIHVSDDTLKYPLLFQNEHFRLYKP